MMQYFYDEEILKEEPEDKDILKGNAKDIIPVISSIDKLEELDALRVSEEEGRCRKSVLSAIEDKIDKILDSSMPISPPVIDDEDVVTSPSSKHKVDRPVKKYVKDKISPIGESQKAIYEEHHLRLRSGKDL